MKQQTQIILTICFAFYLIVFLLTDISLTGFWTEVIFSVLLSFLAFRIVFKSKTKKLWLTIILKTTNVFCLLIIFGIFGSFMNFFFIDTFKLRSFYYQSVEGRLFNAYFKPVGAYSGGYGNFWITETPKYFPLIEWRVYWNRTIHHDFNDDMFDGSPIDNYEVVRGYIKSEVINEQE